MSSRLTKPLSDVPLIRRRVAELEREIEELRAMPCVCATEFCFACQAEVTLRRQIADLRQSLAEVA